MLLWLPHRLGALCQSGLLPILLNQVLRDPRPLVSCELHQYCFGELRAEKRRSHLGISRHSILQTCSVGRIRNGLKQAGSL